MADIVKALYNCAFTVWNALMKIAMTLFTTSPKLAGGGTPYSTVHTFYNAIADATVPIATVFFIIAIYKSVVSAPPGQQAQRFLHDALRYCIILYIAANMWSIMGYIIDFTDGITGKISATSGYTLSVSGDMENIIDTCLKLPSFELSGEWLEKFWSTIGCSLLFLIGGIVLLFIMVASCLSIISSAFQRILKPLMILPFAGIAIALGAGGHDIYHTKINNKDDYMLDVVKKLNAQGYGKSTFIVAGRLDEVFTTYITDNFIDESEVDEDMFDEFLTETKQIYVDSDVTLNSIIGSHYFMCDKTNKLADKHLYARKYTCPNVLDEILVEKLNVGQTPCQYDDVDFMQIIERNNVAGNVYQRFLDSIPNMIPLLYSRMRWNTLQKAIEELRWNGYGFDVLYPAFNIKNAIADELSSDEIKAEFERLFGDDADEIKKRYLLEVADASQIVLVTEYRTFMKRLLDMRYDSSLRTNLGISMTDDRKHNLQRLYVGCLEQEGLKGAHALKIVFHIAWIRTLDFFRRQAQFSMQAKL